MENKIILWDIMKDWNTKNKKIYWYIALSLILFGVLFSLIVIKGCNQNKNIIKIGAILPLTGDAALAGTNTKLGIDLALESLKKNNILGKDSIIVIYEDTKTDPKLAVTAVQKLIDIDKVCYIIDNSISDITLAVAPIVEKNKAILLSTGGSSPLITNAGNNIFRIWNSDNEEANVMANFVKDSLKPSKILILNVNNEYGVGLKNAFEKNMPNNILLKFIDFDKNEINFGKLLIDANKYELIYIIAYSNQTINILNKLKEINFNGKILGTSVMLDPGVTSTISDLKFEAYYPVPSVPDSLNSLFKTFLSEYKLKYNSSPVPLADVGYDAIMLLAEVLKTRDKSKDLYENILLYFNKGLLFNGASGEIQFDKNGDIHKPIIIKKIKHN